MTRIDRTSGAGGPDKSEGPKGPRGPDKVEPSDFVKSIGAVPSVTPAAGPNAALQARMHSRIQDGLRRSLSREDILREVVDAELHDAFGGRATPQMKESVSAAFEDEPRLRSMFSDLYDRAVRGT